MDDEVVKLRQIMRDGFLTPQLHRIERFLLTLTETEKKIKFTSPEEMSLAQTYHQAWWFRNRLLKSQYPKRKESKKFPEFIFPDFQPQAESYIESLVGADKDMATNLVTPKQLATNMKAAYEFLERKKSDPANVITETEKRSSLVFPYKIPAGTTWGNITVIFKTDESVQIRIGNRIVDTTFVEMDFADARNGKPNEQWRLFRTIARKNGTLRASDPEAEPKFVKQKELLAERLKNYFKTDIDPFYPYKNKKAYALKMVIFYEDEPVAVRRKSQGEEISSEVAVIFGNLNNHSE